MAKKDDLKIWSSHRERFEAAIEDMDPALVDRIKDRTTPLVSDDPEIINTMIIYTHALAEVLPMYR